MKRQGRARERRPALAWLAVASVMAMGARAAGAATAAPSFPVVGSVAIVAPGPPDPVVTEAVSRLRFELNVVGLASHTVSCSDVAAADARACSRAGRVDSVPSEQKAMATGQPAASIVVAREDGVVTLEVIERLSNGSKFFRLVYVPAAEGGKDPAVLAIRGVELLRDVHLDVERTGAASVPARVVLAGASVTAPPLTLPPPPKATVVADAPPALQKSDSEETSGHASAPAAVVVAPAPRSEVAMAPPRWTVHASLGMLQGRAGLGPSLGPALGATFRLRPELAMWTTWAGPFYEDLHQDVATAATRQEFAMAGARFDFGAHRARPFVTAGAGLHHLRIAGTSSAPGDAPLASGLWAALVVGGAGCSYPLGNRVEVAVEGQAFLTGPSGTITIHGVEVGRTGAPSLLAQAELRVLLD